MYFSKASIERAAGSLTGDICIRCGGPLDYVSTGRSIWVQPFCGGGGDVSQVAEVYCPSCDGKKAPPTYGTPIYEDDLIELVV